MVMVFNATLLKIFHLNRGGQIYWSKKPPNYLQNIPHLFNLLVTQKQLFNYFAFQSLVYERT